MAATQAPEQAGARPFDDLAGAASVWPRGDRLEAIRSAAEGFRGRFKAQGAVRGVRTVDLASTGYPTRYAFGGAARGGVSPYVRVLSRMAVLQFEDLAGALKILCWEPPTVQGAAGAPLYAQMIDRYGALASRGVKAREVHALAEGLAVCGLTPEDVDFVSFGSLQLQDPRGLIGTQRALEGEREARTAAFPNARFLLARREVDTFRSPHPVQSAWYVRGGMDHVDEDRLVLLDGDVELGAGVALVSTPGHTDGNQSLVLNTADGVWVSSSNGVAADNWHPHLSKIPGVRKEAELMGREVVPRSSTLEDSIDQYDSMVKEKAIADPNRADPRWMNILPSAEMLASRRHWPIVPSFAYGGISYGTIEPPVR